jgi:phosphoribosylanthranilate isomerase
MSNRVEVKICGITNTHDALVAVRAGADMLGFNFYERSVRHVAPREAAAIIAQTRKAHPAVRCIGVFVDAAPASIRELAAEVDLDGVQLHGNEVPEDCRTLSELRVIKALRVHRDFDPAVVSHYDCDTILLDTWHPGHFGGTGERFDWSVAANVRARVERLILAGGLDARNVAEAIHQVRPDAVDVCSGVEDAPGRKNAEKIEDFIDAARKAAIATEAST